MCRRRFFLSIFSVPSMTLETVVDTTRKMSRSNNQYRHFEHRYRTEESFYSLTVLRPEAIQKNRFDTAFVREATNNGILTRHAVSSGQLDQLVAIVAANASKARRRIAWLHRVCVEDTRRSTTCVLRTHQRR